MKPAERRVSLFVSLLGTLALLAVATAGHAQFLAFTPPPCQSDPFLDVPVSHPFCAWIQQLKNDGVTAGCGGGNYCPQSSVTRGQMAVFIERGMRGTATWSPSQGVFRRTMLVSPVPGDATASGTALLAAMAGITDASASNPYLLKIEPGLYVLGSNPLNLKLYVDVEGSGEAVTKITGTGSSSEFTGTLVASAIPAGTVEVRFLTAENTGGDSYAAAIFNTGSSAKLTNVTAASSGATSINSGVYDYDSSTVMTNVTATASGGNQAFGVYETATSSSTMTNVAATASGASVFNNGVFADGNSTTSIHGSRLKGSQALLVTNGLAKVSATLLDGGKGGAGSFACVGAFNASYVALNASCQ